MGKLILVGDLGSKPEQQSITAVHARVSSVDQRPDLDRQVARVSAWATGHGLSVEQIVTEVGSGLNGKRRRFLSLLNDQSVTMIIVEHRDRFARFGSEYVAAKRPRTSKRASPRSSSDARLASPGADPAPAYRVLRRAD